METQKNEGEVKIPPFDQDPKLSLEVREFLKALNAPGGVPLETLPPLEARKVLFDSQLSVKIDMSGVEETEHIIYADGYEILLNIVRPEGVKTELPVFIFIHGGGWVLGDYPTHKRMVRDLVVLSAAAGVFVNYTRTPDAAYPKAINEIFAATKWVAAHGRDINVDGKRLAVIGNSVGGNMTAVTALKAKENDGPEIKVQIMMWPIVDADFGTYSFKRFGKDRFLTTPLMKWMYDMYIPDPDKRQDIYASPLQATKEQLTGLPPAVIVVAENDILRDGGEAYGRKLDEAGVRTTVARFNGVIHDFGLLNQLAYIHPTRSLFAFCAAELKKHLS